MALSLPCPLKRFRERTGKRWRRNAPHVAIAETAMTARNYWSKRRLLAATRLNPRGREEVFEENSCAAAVAARASQSAPTENVLQTGHIRSLATCSVDIEKL
jgi:hypothetical protein